MTRQWSSDQFAIDGVVVMSVSTRIAGASDRELFNRICR
jgi:hypothetical protein